LISSITLTKIGTFRFKDKVHFIHGSSKLDSLRAISALNDVVMERLMKEKSVMIQVIDHSQIV